MLRGLFSQEWFMGTVVSILAEIPEELHETLKTYLDRHPDWDQDRVFTAALSLFLLQNGDTDRRAARIYLNSLFQPLGDSGFAWRERR
ncbi:MAG: DUF2811 domain-containing protein [Thermostichales cyanobacterium BF4_bins_65]